MTGRTPAAQQRAVVAAEVCSVLGDQFSKVALTVTVFDRTGSAALGGLAYGLTFFPPLLTGTGLGWLADRLPRREVMVACALLQAAVLTVVAACGAPTLLLAAGSAAVGAIAPIFKAAQAALVGDILGDEAAARARPLLFVVREGGLLLGLAVGGVTVVATGAVPALVVDAASFLAAAAILGLGVCHRPAATASTASATRPPPAVRLRRRPEVLAMLVVPAAIGLSTAPTAVIVPLADEVGVPRSAVGALLAVDSVGLLVVGLILTRLGRGTQARLLWPLAALTVAPLLLLPLTPPLAVVFVLFALTGAGSIALAPAQTRLLDLLPDRSRGRAGALASTLLRVAQGSAAVLAGTLTAALGHATTAVAVVAVAAAAVLAVAALAIARAAGRAT